MRKSLCELATAHIEKLCRRYDISITWHTNFGINAFASLEDRHVRTPPIETAFDYFVALHEIGHIVAPRARRYNAKGEHVVHATPDEIAVEGAAWAWAAKTANPEIMAMMTGKEWREVGRRFTTYISYYATR